MPATESRARKAVRPGGDVVRPSSRVRRSAKQGAKAIPDHRRMHESSWSREDAIAWLDSPERRSSQDPVRLWRRVGLRAGDTVVDVGAGTGFFSFPAAAQVGPGGRVYAVDVSEELVDLVRERAAERHVANVTSVLSTRTRIPIEDSVADVTILANILHGIPPKTVDEAIRLLRPGGRLVNVDWKKEASPDGPPVGHRLSADEATSALTAHGLRPLDSFDLGPHHYVLVFERPRPSHLPGHLLSDE